MLILSDKYNIIDSSSALIAPGSVVTPSLLNKVKVPVKQQRYIDLQVKLEHQIIVDTDLLVSRVRKSLKTFKVKTNVTDNKESITCFCVGKVTSDKKVFLLS